MKRRKTERGFLLTDLGKLRSRRPKTDRLIAPDSQLERQLAHERLLEELGAAGTTEVISVLMPRIVEDLSDERKIGLYFDICTLILIAAEKGEDISAVIPAVVKLLERAAEDPELYSSERNEAALMKATSSLRIAAERGMEGMGSGEVRSALDAMLNHSNERIRIDAGAAIFCLPEPLQDEETITLFSEDESGMAGKVAEITALCAAICSGRNRNDITLRLLHKESEGSESIILNMDDGRWERRITDEGIEIWLRGRYGNVEAKVGWPVVIFLPDFDPGDAEVCDSETILCPYTKNGEGGYMELASGFSIRTGPGKLIESEDGDLADAKVSIELHGEKGAYRREFLLSGIGRRKSVRIDNVKTDVTLEPDGIRISKGIC